MQAPGELPHISHNPVESSAPSRIDHVPSPIEEKTTASTAGKIPVINLASKILSCVASIITGNSSSLIRSINSLYEKIIQKQPILHELHQLEREVKNLVGTEKRSSDLNRVEALQDLKAKILKFNESNDIKFFEPENLSLDSQSRSNRNRTENLLNKVNKELKMLGMGLPSLPGTPLKTLQSELALLQKKQAAMKAEGEGLYSKTEYSKIDNEIKNLKKDRIATLDSEIKALNIQHEAIKDTSKSKADAIKDQIINLQNERLNLSIASTLAPKVSSMGKTFEASSNALKLIAEDRAVQGKKVTSKEAIKHLEKFNREVFKIKGKVLTVHTELKALNEFLKTSAEPITYDSLGQGQREVLAIAHQECSDMSNAIGAIVNDISVDMYHAFQEKPINFPVEIVLNNSLLNCKIKVNSQEELDSLKKACYESRLRLSSFRNEMRGITRFSGEHTFGNFPLKNIAYHFSFKKPILGHSTENEIPPPSP